VNNSLRAHAASTRGALAAALIVLTGLTAGCSEGFDPFNRLVTPRVLAIRSEPVAPAMGETTNLDALLYVPPDDAVASMSWSWCPFAGPSNAGYPCLISEDDLAALSGDPSAPFPPYDLGEGETASFEHSLDPALLAAACAGAADQPGLLNCDGGFPAQIKLTMRTEQGREVTSVRTLRLRFDDSQEPNQNPSVDGLRAVVGDDDQAIGDEPTVTLPRHDETVVRVAVPPAVIERYTGTDDNGDPEERAERLTITWFVESGDMKFARTVFIEDVEPLDDAEENEWTPDNTLDYAPDTSEVVVVVRDDREGVAWTRGVVSLEASP
jgi:hypothetical protein